MRIPSIAARFFALAISVTLFAPPALAQDSPSPVPSSAPTPEVSGTTVPTAGGPYASAIAQIAHHAPEFMRRQHAPGMVLALTDRQATIAVLPFGEADRERHLPVTRDTRFGIGSITKSMTAIGLLEARDRGAFDPHAPVTRYVPWFSVRTRWRPLTGHDILTHTSGLPDGGGGPGEPYDVVMLRTMATAFAPGTHWSYSNLGYETLGTMLSSIDQRPWSTIVRDDVFGPLGMTASAANWSFDSLATAATGYLPREDDRIPDPRDWDLAPVPAAQFSDPAGSVLSTGGDMATYARMILNGGLVVETGRRLISPASYRLLTTPFATAGSSSVPGLYEHYAYGLAVHRLDGDRIVGHTGGTTPYTACMEVDLTTGFAAVALTNVGYIAERPCAAVEYSLRTLRAAAKKTAFPGLPKATDPARVPHASAFAGTYRTQGHDATITIVATQPDRLALLVNGTPHPLLRAAPGIFWTDNARYRLSGIRFITNGKTHRADELVAAGRWYASSRYRGPTTFPHPSAWSRYVGYYRTTSHPWDLSLRVQLVKGQLVVDDGTPIVALDDSSFRVGEETWNPDRLRFDTMVNGKAQHAVFTGTDLYRAPSQ